MFPVACLMLKSFRSMYRILALAIFVTCAYTQNSPQELVNKAFAAKHAGNFEEAIRIYRSLLEKFPNIPEIRSNLGAALAGEGRYSEAIRSIRGLWN